MSGWIKSALPAWIGYLAGRKAQQQADKDATEKVSQDVVQAQSDSSTLTDEQLRDRLRNPGTYRK